MKKSIIVLILSSVILFSTTDVSFAQTRGQKICHKMYGNGILYSSCRNVGLGSVIDDGLTVNPKVLYQRVRRINRHDRHDRIRVKKNERTRVR